MLSPQSGESMCGGIERSAWSPAYRRETMAPKVPGRLKSVQPGKIEEDAGDRAIPFELWLEFCTIRVPIPGVYNPSAGV